MSGTALNAASNGRWLDEPELEPLLLQPQSQAALTVATHSDRHRTTLSIFDSETALDALASEFLDTSDRAAAHRSVGCARHRMSSRRNACLTSIRSRATESSRLTPHPQRYRLDARFAIATPQ